MSFPEHIDRLFDVFGVPPDTKQAVYDLYVSMGEEALDVFGDIAERVDSPAALRPEDTAPIPPWPSCGKYSRTSTSRPAIATARSRASSAATATGTSSPSPPPSAGCARGASAPTSCAAPRWHRPTR